MAAERSPARRAALYGLLVAAAFVFGYLESLLPSVGVPGIKLGLANLVTVVALYRLRAADAAGVALLRILLSGLTFGSPAAMLYALAGGLCSLAAMVLCRRSGRFSSIGVSMAGGVCHVLGQLAVAAAVLRTWRVAWYLPVLLLSGLLTGALIGAVATALLRRLPDDPAENGAK